MISVYFIRAVSGPVKIGKSKNVGGRFANLQSASPEPLTLIRTIAGGNEAAFHSRFAEYRLHGEWFDCVGALAEFLGVPESFETAKTWCAACQHPTAEPEKPKPTRIPFDLTERRFVKEREAWLATGKPFWSIWTGPHSFEFRSSWP